MKTVTEAAVQLGVTSRRVRALIQSGKLAATKKGKTWIISEGALAVVAKQERRPGRPRK